MSGGKYKYRRREIEFRCIQEFADRVRNLPDQRETRIEHRCRYLDELRAREWLFRAGSCYSGIGFVFSNADPFAGIDLDDWLDSQGSVKPWASSIVEQFADSYMEISRVISQGEHGQIAYVQLPSDRVRDGSCINGGCGATQNWP